MKQLQRLLAVCLCLAMLLAMAPVDTVIAASSGSAELEDGDIVIDLSGTTTVASGTCGANLTWKLTKNGKLTISGTGEMNDYYDRDTHTRLDRPWQSYLDDITSVEIKEGVTDIGDMAFYYLEQLQSITIPDSVTGIGYFAFCACKKLSQLTLPSGLTHIGDNAFTLCTGFESITVPEGVISIGEGAFNGCSGLQSISLPSSLKSIGANAFYQCAALQSIVIPEGVTAICNDTFADCTSLASVTIPSSVTGIGSYAFSECDSLRTITIPDSVRSIGHHAFSGCGYLQQITIPEGVQTVEKYTFYRCSNLKSATIPASVTLIDEYAFSGCASLTDVYYGGSASQWAQISIVWDNTYLKNAKIHCAVVEQTGITVTPPAKTEYWVGEELDFTGMTVTAIYSDGSTKDVTEDYRDDYTVTGYEAGTVGEQTVTVSYAGFTDTFAVTVKEPAVTGITVTAPARTEYVQGEELDTIGMVVTAIYSDGSEEELSDGYELSGFDTDTVGEQTVTVTYESFTATFTVTVEAAVLVGDVNGDGSVDTRDRALLTRYLADWENCQIDLRAADVNADGQVDTRDRAILTRYLSDWESYPALPYTG